MPERYVGRTVGRFRIGELIGSGGFAWVYRAFDPQLEAPVAIKILKPQYAGDETFESRFRREASIAARLRHPNIVRIIEVGQDQGAVYFAMDYLPHGLVERLRVMETLPESLLVRLGMDVASALAFAHRAGVVHRDIKADNILFDEHGNAIVADFGIARALSGTMVDQTGTNMVVGTPQYFSPEQARGLALDGRSDIYSLGVTLYRAATGHVPFEGEDWYDIARQHVEERPTPPREYNASLSPALEAIVLRCLAKKPDDRYASAEELHEALAEHAPRGSSPDLSRTLELPRFPARTPPRALPRSRAARRVRLRGLAWAGAAAILGAVGVALAVSKPGGAEPGGAGAATPAPPLQLPAESVVAGTLRDSAGRPILAGPGGLPARPRLGTLRIDAPREASVTVNGIAVGRGGWRADTLPPDSYAVAAFVRSTLAGCPSEREERRVAVTAGGAARLTMRPRGCGYLVIDARPDGAQYAVTADDGSTITGTVSGATPVLLPEGAYRLRVLATGCRTYESGSITVLELQTTRKRVNLLCDAAGDA